MKVKLSKNLTDSHLLNDDGIPFCAIPIIVSKSLNIANLYNILVKIDPMLPSYKNTNSYYTIYIPLPLDVQLDVKETNLSGYENLYEILWSNSSIEPLNSIPCYILKTHCEIVKE